MYRLARALTETEIALKTYPPAETDYVCANRSHASLRHRDLLVAAFGQAMLQSGLLMQRDLGSSHRLGFGLSAAASILMAACVIGVDELPPASRSIPKPLSDHPGNVFLAGENVRVRVPESLANTANSWRLLDDDYRVARTGVLPVDSSSRFAPIDLGAIDIGWYRIEFCISNQPASDWTSAAVLAPLKSQPSSSSPIAVDSATAWFAKNQPDQQRRLASLAALAGVSWVRDRMRWSEMQPVQGPLTNGITTYDTAADIQQAAGLRVLQVFHDTPLWAREQPESAGRFAPDLRSVYGFARALAQRFRGRVSAWEPWNEANIATFGGHTVDQMCSWQKAAFLGFKAGDPQVTVGWNATASVPTPAHTEGVLLNETWPYFDTYNIHTYDWAHSYTGLWAPARDAACGRPLWITEADRGTPHLGNDPWFDQDPKMERLKAEYIAQSYASSLFAGAQRHFHFILGHYHEPNRIQFGLLRLDHTPRPAYVALAAVGRCLADARVLGRWRPGNDIQVYAFRARPDGEERDVLVVWAEKELDWDGRGQTAVEWPLPASIQVSEAIDYLGRSLGKRVPNPVRSAPFFVYLPPGQAASLPLEPPPSMAPNRVGTPCPVVLQWASSPERLARIEDRAWSEGYAYAAVPTETMRYQIHIYNFSEKDVKGALEILGAPPRWQITYPIQPFAVGSQSKTSLSTTLKVPLNTATNGWIVFRANCGGLGQPVLAARFVVSLPVP